MSGNEQRFAPPYPYLTYRRFMIDTYGTPLHRVPIDLGFGCPNRRPDGSGGCAFCAEDGGRARQTLGAADVAEQIRAGVDFARRRYAATQFMAYIQAYTGTFASPAEQAACYDDILRQHPFRAISIGTRPDCLNETTLAVLSELAERIETWVELGVQTVHDETLRVVGRGHDWQDSVSAIRALDERGIRVAAHVIIGLPGENGTHFRITAEMLARQPLAGIKIHNLHVIRGTRMADMYAEGRVRPLDAEEYADVLIDVIRRLPPRLPIMRICTDTPADRLLAPRWTMDKARFIAHVRTEMTRRGVRQGDQCS